VSTRAGTPAQPSDLVDLDARLDAERIRQVESTLARLGLERRRTAELAYELKNIIGA